MVNCKPIFLAPKARKGLLMAQPIVFAKCDARPGKETLVLICRPDSSTTKGEKQIIIRARSLGQDALSEMEYFVDAASPILQENGRGMRDKPIEVLHVDVGGEGITVEEW